MSYSRLHIKTKIGKIKPKKRLLMSVWFWIFILTTFLAIGTIYFLLFYPGFQLENVLISQDDQSATYQQIKDLVIEDSKIQLINFWKIKISSKSIFLVNAKKIGENISKKYPQIEIAEIKKQFPKSLNVVVSLRQPIAIYCQPDKTYGCLLVDKNGVSFEQLNDLIDGFPILRQSDSLSRLELGEEIISKDIMNAIYKIEELLSEDFGIEIKQILVESKKISILTNKNWNAYLEVKDGSDIDLLVTKLSLILKDNLENLHYIDLRPRDRAIICNNDICANN